ncbi:cyclic lactone autoinducer peptide [Clostridium beijerinckii]|uniref:Cyclic lactone autoinducer peptide n=1 Tax=Clostridium beijerinckii TaxID=1520 RepID=A0AAX0AVG0_CLOBE|nr:cyclic lactone autoinducer peptide [Clostridium beijerinckii]NRT87137.1 cyclic lactone autoinducer peptide [Clostridium beijerinckii]NYC72568.1 cyclic lactone autoinducer peptide [Clostridium beijerinckii]
MKFKVKKIIATAATKVCKISAESVSASACWAGLFQPKEPECLKKDK